MIRFLDGPAAGQTMSLARAPFFLRLAEEDGQWDALDQLADQAGPGERLYCYLRTGRPVRGMVDHRAKGGGRTGRPFVRVDYRLHRNQPADRDMRRNPQWRAWCTAEAGRMRRAGAITPGIDT